MMRYWWIETIGLAKKPFVVWWDGTAVKRKGKV
jgi:hypothetical protein